MSQPSPRSAWPTSIHPSDTPLESRLRERLTALTTERQTFLDQAQRNLVAYDASIAELTALLTPPADDDEAGG